MNSPEPPAKTHAAAPSAKTDAKDDLKTLSLPQVMMRLGSVDDGLREAAHRLSHSGPHELTGKKTNPFLKFLSYARGHARWEQVRSK